MHNFTCQKNQRYSSKKPGHFHVFWNLKMSINVQSSFENWNQWTHQTYMVGESGGVEAAAAAAARAASFSEFVEGFDEFEWAATRVRPEFGNRGEPAKIRLSEGPIRPWNNRVPMGFWPNRIGMRMADIAWPEKSKLPSSEKCKWHWKEPNLANLNCI